MGRLIVFAGLPGSGKTTLATLLAKEIGAVLLNKDVLRAALFVPEHIEYSSRQNDFCMELLYDLAGYHLRNFPDRDIIIDGRTYSKKQQVDRLLHRANEWPFDLFMIECRARMEMLLIRVQADGSQHLAQDRTVEMVKASYLAAEAMEVDRLIVPTDELSTSEALQLIREQLRA
jgi:predicted kinase